MRSKTYIPNREEIERRLDKLYRMITEISKVKDVASLFAEKTGKDHIKSYMTCYNVLRKKYFTSQSDAELVIKVSKIALLKRIGEIEKSAKESRKVLSGL